MGFGNGSESGNSILAQCGSGSRDLIIRKSKMLQLKKISVYLSKLEKPPVIKKRTSSTLIQFLNFVGHCFPARFKSGFPNAVRVRIQPTKINADSCEPGSGSLTLLLRIRLYNRFLKFTHHG
jgi:hypothetical protein